MENRPTRTSVKVLGWLFIVLIGVGAAELGTFAYWTLRDGRLVSARTRMVESRNLFLNTFGEGVECRYNDTIYPHPYLAFVQTDIRKPTCKEAYWINSLGMIGREYPIERDDKQFSILLTGGSVAGLLGQVSRTGPLFLEEALNRCYRPPHGERFAVFNGGHGGWREPQPAILVLLYGEAFDGIVTLAGFNESMSFRAWAGQRLELPPANYVLLNPMVAGSYDKIGAVWLSNLFTRLLADHWLTSRSFLAFSALRAIRARLERYGYRASPSEAAFDRMFALPADWPAERRFAHNLDEFRKYARAVASMTSARASRAAFFVQPVPAIGKTLTEEEKGVVGVLDYADTYRRITNGLLALRDEGHTVFSLLDIFANETGTVYGDEIHMKDDRANRLLAAAIARRLAEAWKLERTCGDP